MTTVGQASRIARVKGHLRREMKAKLAAMSPAEASAKSAKACLALVALPEFRGAEVVMLYLPTPQEVDTAQVALHAWQADKTVLAPKVNWSQKHMLAVEIRSLDDGLATSRLTVREPAEGAACPPEEIDFIIVPALAYDRRGGRLGRGGGFYDRFLAQPGLRAVRCGLGFDEQVVEELPAEAHDRPVDILVTDKEVLRFSRSD